MLHVTYRSQCQKIIFILICLLEFTFINLTASKDFENVPSFLRNDQKLIKLISYFSLILTVEFCYVIPQWINMSGFGKPNERQ